MKKRDLKADLGLPRMRGDRPCQKRLVYIRLVFTPHARGSTPPVFSSIQYTIVYPACAGIDPRHSICSVLVPRLPRMRGDRPLVLEVRDVHFAFTPHARGSTLGGDALFLGLRVYPACAGIDRGLFCKTPSLTRLPRMRGDRPCVGKREKNSDRFTPHARGSTASAA